MDILRPVDNYVAELISAFRKAFEVARNMTQTEALRQKWRYDQKALTVTLNKGDVVLVRNNQFIGKRKLKDRWGDEIYTMCDQVNVDVPVYIIENQRGRRQTLHQNQLFLVKRIDPEQDHQIVARLFEVASTQIGCEVPHQKIYEGSTPPIEVQAQAASLLDIDAPDVQVLKLQKLIASAYRVLRTIFAGWWFEKVSIGILLC